MVDLVKRGCNPGDIDSLLESTAAFSGAEIKQVVVSALYHAFAEKQSLSVQMLHDEIDKTQPLSAAMGKNIAALQQWAQERTVPAN